MYTVTRSDNSPKDVKSSNEKPGVLPLAVGDLELTLENCESSVKQIHARLGRIYLPEPILTGPVEDLKEPKDTVEELRNCISRLHNLASGLRGAVEHLEKIN